MWMNLKGIFIFIHHLMCWSFPRRSSLRPKPLMYVHVHISLDWFVNFDYGIVQLVMLLELRTQTHTPIRDAEEQIKAKWLFLIIILCQHIQFVRCSDWCERRAITLSGVYVIELNEINDTRTYSQRHSHLYGVAYMWMRWYAVIAFFI